ncbi:MAG TPA: Mur ligase domain-containing protein, partial [Mariniflexile sp.]|nr:Mur ligase domain-containing protein [Mariniflexile sp.]
MLNDNKVLSFRKGLRWTNVYFIGIGGIGMRGLGRYFVAKGKGVAGDDKTPSEITDSLTALGIE